MKRMYDFKIGLHYDLLVCFVSRFRFNAQLHLTNGNNYNTFLLRLCKMKSLKCNMWSAIWTGRDTAAKVFIFSSRWHSMASQHKNNFIIQTALGFYKCQVFRAVFGQVLVFFTFLHHWVVESIDVSEKRIASIFRVTTYGSGGYCSSWKENPYPRFRHSQLWLAKSPSPFACYRHTPVSSY
jgi:hypothetical protein